ncbi:CD4-1 molecule [Etheostoma cragini]|uniref:CD4-1 molecule n=1 Tax=Etheostoma cragini TaxID=417921 RepID=UPI00155E5D31|nr:CD4-1 molecule [Etheostoma cragini]XP_034730138.1 CD4-1 molecule [Etheostoma cragini]
MKNVIQSVLLLAVLVSTKGAQELTYYVQVGETVTLKPPGVDSQKYVYWYFNGIEIAWRNNMGTTWTYKDSPWKDRLALSDDSLIIKNLQQEDFGIFKYECKVQSETYVKKTYKLLKLTVSVNPTAPLLPGENVALSCNAETDGHKKPEIHWLNPQGVKMRTGQLNWRATSQDNGHWTCVVKKEQESLAKVYVTVIDLSPAPLSPQYTSTSRLLTIPCSLPSYISWEQIKAKDIQELHWQFIPEPGLSPQELFSLSLEDPLTSKAGPIRGRHTVKDPKNKNLSLTINQVREEDRGNYVCALRFKNGVSLNRTVHVKVLQITSSPGTELISGQQLNLTCSLGHPLPPDLRLKWFPPEQSVLSSSSLGSDGHPTHLTIPEVGTGDGGKWRCALWQNNTELTSAEITLKIESKLSVWMLVVICSVAVIFLLLILVFILYQRRQRKMRHLGRRLCQCKNPKSKGFYRT